MRTLFLFALTALLAFPASARSFRATVAHVSDGDSFHVRDESGNKWEVRLRGIDAPEKKQPHGDDARSSLVRILGIGPIVVESDETDPHGRLLARVTRDGADVAVQQLRAGFAWVYPFEDSISQTERARYTNEERTARSAKRGLWSDGTATPPWTFRRSERDSSTSGTSSGAVIGNIRSKLYHLPNCPGYMSVSSANRVVFSSAQAAEKAGYKRASNCR